MSPSKREPDRRVMRTRHALVAALVELVLEKRYAKVTIQDLLDRAQVARATFYAHYRGKDDLLLRSFEGLLDMLDQSMTSAAERKPRPASGEPQAAPEALRLAPVRELFHHVGQSRRFHQALARAGMLDQLYRVGTDRLSASIQARLELRRDVPHSGSPPAPPAPILARALAGSLFALLAWWVKNDNPYSSEQMDGMFHAICPQGA